MTTPTHRAHRVAPAPLRLGYLTRRRLERLGRRDATSIRAAGTQSSERPDDDARAVTTPTVHAIQVHADAYARREEQRFFSHVHRELAEHRVLSKSLAADLDRYDEKFGGLAPERRESIAGGRGPASEELRRIARSITRESHRVDDLSASIQCHFIAAKLRAGRFYDYSDMKVAVYWRGLTRLGAPERIAERAPLLVRSDWLAVKQDSTLLQLWEESTDVKA
jgi:hypothetical protein